MVKKVLSELRIYLAAQPLGMDDLSILALSIAIFNTSGTWLQTEIAYQLITENIFNTGTTNTILILGMKTRLLAVLLVLLVTVLYENMILMTLGVRLINWQVYVKL